MKHVEYFEFNNVIDPSQDEIIKFLNEDNGKDYSAASPDRILPMSEYMKMTRSEIGKWYKENPANVYSMYQKLREQQIVELHKATAELKRFYTTAWNYGDYKTNGFSPMEIARLTLQKKIRVARLREVLQPQFAEVLVPHSKTKHKYWVAKAYWWDDNGNRSRSINKSIRRSDVELVDKLIEIYQNMDFETSKDIKLKNNSTADIVLRKKSEEYVVEVKMMSDRDLALFILSNSMWSEYQKIYQKK